MRMRTGWMGACVAVAVVVAMAASGVPAGAVEGPAPARQAPTPSLDVVTSDSPIAEVLPEDDAAPAAKAELDVEAPADAGAPAEPVETRGAPANPEPVELVQPDGSTFTARQWGDGVLGGFEDLDGHTIGQDDDGTWVYVEDVDPTGEVVLGDVPADAPPPADLTPQLRGDDPGSLPSAAPAAPSDAPHVPHSGAAPTLVILAAFNNQAGSTTASAWATSFFGASGSVRKYYTDASYGKLSVNPVAETHGTANDGVVGWVTLSRAHPNTGRMDTVTEYTNVQNTVREAVLAANPYVNFATYDTNGNGAIEPRELHVVVITAGYEASYSTACGNTVWGHQWALSYATPPVVDGKTVTGTGGGAYTMFGERHCSSGADNHQATIGIMVHELGHDLGWPDLYDVSGATQGGVGEFSVMAGGSWSYTSGFAGSLPTLPDAFSRSYQGWVTPTQVTGTGQTRTVPAASGSPTVYRLRDNPGGVDWAFSNSGNQTGTGEYFLVENRTYSGWDASLPGCGILIWHIDETRSASTPNATASRRLVQLEQADGLGHMDGTTNRGDTGDPYPGSSGKTAFNVSTTPNSRLYSGADSQVGVQIPAGACTASKSVTFSSSAPTRPANDDFGSAEVLSGTSGTRTGSTVEATKQAGEASHAGRTGGASIWYRWTAGSSGRLRVSLAGSSFDTTLGIYVGGSVSTTTTVASNDDASGGLQSLVDNLPVVRGATYYIAVDGYGSADRGSVALAWTFTATPGPAPLASWTAFVQRQYRDFMGRAPTSNELVTWVAKLANPAERGNLVATLRSTARHTSVVDPVVRLYRAYFLRHPDRGGLLYWIGEREGGKSLNQVSQAFSAAPEFRTLYGSLSNRAFVELIYQNILGRPGEAAGVAYWTAELDSHRRGRGSVMTGFSESPEYRTRMRVEVDVAVVTLLMLRRVPTAAEVAMFRYEQSQGRFDNARLAEWALAHTTYPAS